MPRVDIHRVLLKIAQQIATLSYAERLQVGCVVYKKGNIISFGYNGTLPGLNNTAEENGLTIPTVMHAEENAIIKLAKGDGRIKNSIIYVTTAPCISCATLLVACKVKKVYYIDDYRDSAGIEFLTNNKIEYEKLFIHSD